MMTAELRDIRGYGTRSTRAGRCRCRREPTGHSQSSMAAAGRQQGAPLLWRMAAPTLALCAGLLCADPSAAQQQDQTPQQNPSQPRQLLPPSLREPGTAPPPPATGRPPSNEAIPRAEIPPPPTGDEKSVVRPPSQDSRMPVIKPPDTTDDGTVKPR